MKYASKADIDFCRQLLILHRDKLKANENAEYVAIKTIPRINRVILEMEDMS